MEEINNIEITKEETLKESDILIKIWSKPREIFRYINDNSIDKFTITLLFLAGITRSFDRAVSNNYGDNLSLLVLVLLAVTLGGLLGWLSIYIYAALLNWTGGWLKSKGNTDAIVRMLAHALIP